MKTLIIAAALLIPATLFAAPPVQAPLQAPGKAVQAPTQAPVQAPMKTAAAPRAGGYRTFSYEPGYQPAMAPMNYGAGSYRFGSRPGAARSGFHDAGFKVRGDF